MKNIFLTWSVFLTLLSGPSGWAQDTSHSLTIFVDGVCGMCEERIEAAALQLAGVETASWEAGSRLLTVVLSDPDFDEMQLHYAVSGIGHDTRKLR
ncbi:MAG: cation transporter, partial [Saprospiraceae bacterium]|nr:cation transporter [Saprospiraceae bacterium]